MNESARLDGESISRQEAAERLTDIAYALMAGGSLRLDGGRLVDVPDRIVLTRTGRSTSDRVALALELSWATAAGPASADSARDEEV